MIARATTRIRTPPATGRLPADPGHHPRREHPRHAGAAAGALTTAQQVGGALGVGVVGIVYYGSLADGVPTAFRHGLIYLVLVALALAGPVQPLPRTAARTKAAPVAREGAHA
ncbi:hypothetical protein [Streptomyces sp. NPDC057582]|uniref:hypothetical protein n=1 Tax=Streptomyces sp. NPDC057582 TaxID=3346174 RepID=UPI00369DDCCC